jgi:carbon storage regulator
VLVLTRKVEETIIIDGTIQITVLAIHGDKIRLGVSAPPAVRIDRQEVHARRVALNEANDHDLTPEMAFP